MNAQREWKSNYRAIKKLLVRDIPTQSAWRRELKRYRREAALERKLAAQQRTIEAQAQEIKRLQELLDMANYAVWRERM